MINHLSKFGRFLLLMGLAMILTGCQSTKMKQATAENENPIDVQEQDTSGTSSVERDSAFNNTVITDPDTPSGAKSLSSSNPPESGGKTDAKLFRDIDTSESGKLTDPLHFTPGKDSRPSAKLTVITVEPSEPVSSTEPQTIPTDQPVESINDSAPQASTTADTPSVEQSNTQEATTLEQPPDPRYSRSPHFSWLKGQLQYRYHNRKWSLRYAPLGDIDPYGGSLLLDGLKLNTTQDGTWIRVDGALREQDGKPEPVFEVESIQQIDS